MSFLYPSYQIQDYYCPTRAKKRVKDGHADLQLLFESMSPKCREL